MVKITSSAAISCLEFLGKNDKELIDKAATDSMRNEINKLKIKGVVVIGEGELDEAPMLHIGEKLGAGGDLELDIAVDPLEGTNFAAKIYLVPYPLYQLLKKVIYLMHLKHI